MIVSALFIAKTFPRMRCGRCWLDVIVVGQIRRYAYRRGFQLLMSFPYRLALGERWVLGWAGWRVLCGAGRRWVMDFLARVSPPRATMHA